MRTFSSITLLTAIFAGAAFADENFEKYDANRDQSVTYVELAQAKKREFDAMDRNRDKAVSSEEFEGAMQAEAEAAPDAKSGSESEGMAKMDFNLFETPAFAKLDGDKDSTVSLAEFGASIKALINGLDTTADNAVSMEEYSTALSSAKAKAAAAAPKKGSGPKGSAPKKPSASGT